MKESQFMSGGLGGPVFKGPESKFGKPAPKHRKPKSVSGSTAIGSGHEGQTVLNFETDE